MKQHLDLQGANFIMQKMRELKNALLNKLDKNAKATSAEAKAGTDGEKYMTPATTKEAIGQFASKVEVVDNLTTDDATKALSAKQGKALQDNKVGWSDFGSGRTAGLPGVITWGNVTESKHLKAWIGDFDKRTRELKDGGGIKFTQTIQGRRRDGNWANTWAKIKIGNYMILIATTHLSFRETCEKLFLEDYEKPRSTQFYSVMATNPQGGVIDCHFTLNKDGTIQYNDFPSQAYVGSFVMAYQTV